MANMGFLIVKAHETSVEDSLIKGLDHEYSGHN